MNIAHKQIPLEYIIASSWGFMWTRRGIKFYKAGDYLCKAPTGCVWPMSQSTVDKYYEMVN